MSANFFADRSTEINSYDSDIHQNTPDLETQREA